MSTTPIPSSPSPLRGFLSWPAGASLLYLVSAACLLGGAALVLAPGSADEGRLVERFALLGTVQIYVGMLAALAALVCRWQPGNGDAVALMVLMALFLPGMNAGLTTIATHQPWLAVGLGAVGFALAAGCLVVVQRRVSGPWGAGLVVPLALIQAWHALAPGMLGLVYQTGTAPEPLLRAWLPGWWTLVACAALLLGAAWRAQPARDDRPLVAGSGLRWILAVAVLTAGGLHQLLVTYSLNLGVTGWDLAGLMVIGLLLADVLFHRWLMVDSGWLMIMEIAIGFTLLCGARGGNFTGDPNGTMPALSLVCYPPFALALGCAGLSVLAVLRRRPDTAVAAAVWLLAALLTWGISDGRLNLMAGGAGVFALAALLVAGAPRHPLLWLPLLLIMCVGTIHGSLVPALVAAAAMVVRAVRLRSTLTGLIALVPLGAHGLGWISLVLSVMGGWLAVIAAFLLLCGGAWMSWRRARDGAPQLPAATPTT